MPGSGGKRKSNCLWKLYSYSWTEKLLYERKELLAVIRFTRQFRYYLLGRKCIVRTGHSSLTWLLNFKEPQGQLARWLEELSQYYMVVHHRQGSKHANADALSRIEGGNPCLDFRLLVNLEELPCGGCKYCTKAHENWTEFATEVDEAVGLALPMGPERLMQNDEKQIGSLSLDGKVGSALPGESCIYAGSSEQIQGPLRTLSIYSLLLDGNTASFGQNEENRMKGKADPPLTCGEEGNFTYSWPWDPGGCWEHSDVDVVHVDIVTMDKVPRIMTTNTSTPDLVRYFFSCVHPERDER